MTTRIEYNDFGQAFWVDEPLVEPVGVNRFHGTDANGSPVEPPAHDPAAEWRGIAIDYIMRCQQLKAELRRQREAIIEELMDKMHVKLYDIKEEL